MPNYIDIFIVRHGSAAHNENADYDFSENPDPKLTEKGIKQAETTGRYLLKHNQPKFDCVVTSCLSRAIRTGEVIAKELGYKGEIESLSMFDELGGITEEKKEARSSRG